MATRVMALYLEDAKIRLIVAQGRKVERWASIPLEAGLVSGDVILDETKVADKIRELFIAIKHTKSEAAGVQKVMQSMDDIFGGKGKIIVGLSGRDSLYRVLSLPVLSDALLSEAVRHEAGRVLPVSLDELYLAYQRIPGNANETRVFVAAFPKKTTDVLLRTLRLAGVTPRVLDLAPLALCLSINEPRSIVADARIDSLNIMVMADRVPQVIRSLSLQGEEKTISENMPTIIEEFSRTVAFYNSSHQQEPIDSDVPVFVSGDLASAPNTWQALVGKLNSKVAVLPCALQYTEDFPMNDFIVNMGLATKELALEKEPGNYSLVNLNALPASAMPKPINLYRIIVPVVAVAGIVGVVFMWNAWQNTKRSTVSLESRLTATQNLITSNQKSISNLTEQNRMTQAQIQPIKDAANIFTTKLNSITVARHLTDSDVSQIVALKVPPQTAQSQEQAPKPQQSQLEKVYITGLSYSNSAKTVTGLSGTTADILSYAQALRDTGGFSVVVASINYNPTITDTGVVTPSYEFTFQIK